METITVENTTTQKALLDSFNASYNKAARDEAEKVTALTEVGMKGSEIIWAMGTIEGGIIKTHAAEFNSFGDAIDASELIIRFA